MAASYKCLNCGAMLLNNFEMQAHAEDMGHDKFEESTVVIVIEYCQDCGKPCKNEVAKQMHTRQTGHTEYAGTKAAPKPKPAAETPAAETDAAAPMQTDDEAAPKPAATETTPAASATAAAAPMDLDATVADQAISMLPGVEALEEPGLNDGQTKMVRGVADGGGFVAQMFKWSAKDKKWSKHKDVVDEDQPASPEDVEKALAVANAEFLGPLMEMGFAEMRCRKALLLTGNDSVEHGIQWLTDHVEDPLADAPLSIAEVKKALKPKLTPQEKAAKAADLQKRAQAKRKEREAADAIDKEKTNREAGKKLQEQLRLQQDQEQQQFQDWKRREKAEIKAAKAKIQAKLDADRLERGFTTKPSEAAGVVKKKVAPSVKLRGELRNLKNDFPERKDVAFKTLLAYVGNICDNPAEPKFRRIKKENKAFVGRILSCGECGTNFLTACGFKDDGGEFLVCQAAEGESFEVDQILVLKAAKTELEKSIANPFWL